MPGRRGATIIDTKGVIAPGLIDTHNHILFDIFDDDDWLPSQIYQNHDQWPNEPRYEAMLDVKQCLVNDAQGKPTWCARRRTARRRKSALRGGQVRRAEGPRRRHDERSSASRAPPPAASARSRARSISRRTGSDSDKIQTSALFPPSKAPPTACARTSRRRRPTRTSCTSARASTPTRSAEFASSARSPRRPAASTRRRPTITHGTAFGDDRVHADGAGRHEARLVAARRTSPSTAQHRPTSRAALDAGNRRSRSRPTGRWAAARTCSTSCASPTPGTTRTGTTASRRRIWCRWPRATPRQALGLDSELGTLAGATSPTSGVRRRRRASPTTRSSPPARATYASSWSAASSLYGDAALKPAGPAAPGCEAIDVCGTPEVPLRGRAETADKLNQTYAQIKAALEQAMLAPMRSPPATATTSRRWRRCSLPLRIRCDCSVREAVRTHDEVREPRRRPRSGGLRWLEDSDATASAKVASASPTVPGHARVVGAAPTGAWRDSYFKLSGAKLERTSEVRATIIGGVLDLQLVAVPIGRMLAAEGAVFEVTEKYSKPMRFLLTSGSPRRPGRTSSRRRAATASGSCRAGSRGTSRSH